MMMERLTSLPCLCDPGVLPLRLWDANGPKRLSAARPSFSSPLCPPSPPLTSKKRKEKRIMIKEVSLSRTEEIRGKGIKRREEIREKI